MCQKNTVRALHLLMILAVCRKGVESFSPKTEVESWALKGAQTSGRFNVRKVCDLQTSKTTRAVKRRERPYSLA